MSRSGRRAARTRPTASRASIPLAGSPSRLPDRFWEVLAPLSILAPLVLALGAPLGEPVAEDFDFIHAARFEPFSLLDGGGSHAFWRPIPHQIYYAALSPLLLSHPGTVVAVHVVLLACSAWLVHRTMRLWMPAPWAAAVATFPMLSESTRTLIAWPTHFVDVGLLLFSAIALHEASRARSWSALPALLCALLCKEVAVIVALLMPAVAAARTGRAPALVDRRGTRGRGLGRDVALGSSSRGPGVAPCRRARRRSGVRERSHRVGDAQQPPRAGQPLGRTFAA
jgi:hypothetical protein